jgi:AraC-like DNA-binding protein
MTAVAIRISRYVGAARDVGLALPSLDEWQERARAAIECGADLGPADLTALILQLAAPGPSNFAMYCGSCWHLGDLGLVGHAIASCRILEQGLGIWLGHAGEFEPLMRFHSAVQGSTWHLDLRPISGLPAACRRFLVEEWVSAFFAFLKEVVGEAQPQGDIKLRHAPHADIAYAQWLPIAPRFQAEVNRITLSADLLSMPVRSRNDEMLGVILRHFQERSIGVQSFSARVRRQLMANMQEHASLTGTAATLGTSTRTLVRHLATEGTTFGEILEHHRREHALILARDGRLGAKDIARLLGYRSHQSLRKAFVKWTGQPLGQWRTSHNF